MSQTIITLKDKVAIITGSSSGIGAAIAITFCRLGALVTITARDEEKLKEVAAKCKEVSPKGNKEPLIIVGDITDDKVRKSLIEETIKAFGKLDILVNNAGYFLSNNLKSGSSISDLTCMLDVHVRAPFHMMKLAIPWLMKTKGNIINVSSVASIRPASAKGAEYSIAKAGMDQMTRWAALELGSYGIRANTVNPGWIPSNILRRYGLSEDQVAHSREKACRVHALGRVGTVDEVADVVAFLASDLASFVTSVTLPIDGGLSVVPAGYFISPTSSKL